MKTMKKVLALVTTLAMVLTMLVATGLTAFAAEGDVTITINRDSSYDSSATGDREFTAYKVFDATYDSNTASGGGSDAGVPGAIANTGEGFSYTLPADSALVAKLGTWDDEKYELVKPALWQDKNGKFISLDHKRPVGANGISLGEYYGNK